MILLECSRFDKENNIATIEQRNKVLDNDVVEVLRPVGDNIEITLKDMRDDKEIR